MNELFKKLNSVMYDITQEYIEDEKGDSCIDNDNEDEHEDEIAEICAQTADDQLEGLYGMDYTPERMLELIQILNDDPGLVFFNHPINRVEANSVGKDFTAFEIATLKSLGLTNLKVIQS